jgi:hypothetical protein
MCAPVFVVVLANVGVAQYRSETLKAHFWIQSNCQRSILKRRQYSTKPNKESVSVTPRGVGLPTLQCGSGLFVLDLIRNSTYYVDMADCCFVSTVLEEVR